MLRLARCVPLAWRRTHAASVQRLVLRGLTTHTRPTPPTAVTTAAATQRIQHTRAIHTATATATTTTQTITAAQPAATTVAAPAALPTQQQRWDSVRALASRLLDEPEQPADAPAPQSADWIVWPSLRAQAGPNAALHAAAKAAEAEAGEAFTIDEQRELQSEGADAEEAAAAALSARPSLTSSQSLAPSLHSAPHLVMPAVARMWRRLAQLDRAALRKADQRSKGAVVDVSAAPNDDTPAPSGPVWSSRGLFLDGPLGVGKSSALYALTCLARASGWMVVHLSDADAWVGQLGAQELGANKMLVQAIYEAAANCVLPSTASWSAPHSLLQLPLSPALEYTSILEDQGITSFGELLVLALGLEDGSEEAELAIECIMGQLHSMDAAEVPVLIAVDGFDALTQRCFRSAAPDVDAEEALSESELVAPLSTSPFCWMNYARARAFRGGFVLSGESFALVSQAHPELMEHAAAADDDSQQSEDTGANDEFGFGGSHDSAREAPQKNAATSQHIDPIHVVPLPPLSSSSLCRAYIVDRLSRSSDPADAPLATLFSSVPSTDPFWSFVFSRLTAGHFGLIDSMRSLSWLQQFAEGCKLMLLPSEQRALWNAFVEARTSQTLQRFSSIFPESSESGVSSSTSSSSSSTAPSSPPSALQRSLAGFFLAHLPAGFYRDFLRNQGRAAGGGRIGRDSASQQQADANTVARDYNLIALNEVDSVAQIQWIQTTLLRDAAATAAAAKSSGTSFISASASAAGASSFVTESSAWGMLTADLPWDALNKDQLLLVRAAKAEAMHQLVAMGVILQSKGGALQLTPLAKRNPQAGAPEDAGAISLPLRSLNHWSPATDPSILSVADLSPQSLQLHWSLPDSIVDASSRVGIETGAVEHLARVVHVQRADTLEGASTTPTPTTLTLFLPILDSKHLALMMSSDNSSSSAPSSSSSSSSSSAAPLLIHTLHLHQLSEVLQSFQLLVGPSLAVVAVDVQGRRFTWTQLEAMIDAMQEGREQTELPLMQATIVSIEAQPCEDAGVTPANLDAAAPMPKLRLIIVSPHSGSQPTATAASAVDSAAAIPAAADAAASSPRQFHALFDFTSAILGSDLAALLTIPTAELKQIRWK